MDDDSPSTSSSTTAQQQSSDLYCTHKVDMQLTHSWSTTASVVYADNVASRHIYAGH